uniref:NADH dehydrogenase subunit 2 n=1 Tax=Sannella crucifera TaxID=3019673 RepID=UPI0030019745
MKMNSSKMLFITTMMMGIFLTISSNNWIMMWCGLEISLISFIPLIISKMLISAESSIKYFIVQSISSSMLMLSMLVMIMKGDYNYDFMLTTSLLIKLGVVPFHNWVLTVIEGLEFIVAMMMLTVNKLAPMTLLSYVSKSMMTIVGLTILIGSLLGLNQNSIKKLIGYSSIFNMGLILTIIKFNLMWMLYLMMYSIMLFMMFLILKKKKINFINQMIFSDSIVNKISLWVNMLSMGGMPPMMGFSIKYMVMIYMMNVKIYMLIILIMFTSMMVMLFYLRIMFLSMLNNHLINKSKMFILNEISSWTIMINGFSLPIILTLKAYMV